MKPQTRPHFLNRPRLVRVTQKEGTAAGQARSLNRRKVTVTLPKAPWVKK